MFDVMSVDLYSTGIRTKCQSQNYTRVPSTVIEKYSSTTVSRQK
jgi:hypothetical protein